MRVTESIGSVRIELSSAVAGLDINFREISSASNLDIVRSFEEMGAFECTIEEQPSASTAQGAVRDNNLFDVSYHAVWVRRPPNAEIFQRVDIHILAE